MRYRSPLRGTPAAIIGVVLLAGCTNATPFDDEFGLDDHIPNTVIEDFELQAESVRHQLSSPDQLLYIAKSADGDLNCVLSYVQATPEYSDENWASACSPDEYTELARFGWQRVRFYPGGLPSELEGWERATDVVAVEVG